MKKFFIALALVTGSLAHAQKAETPVVTVNGTGTVNVVPDRVLISARVEHNGKSASEVKKQNDQTVSEIIKYLKNQKIEARDIRTEYIRLDKQVHYQTNDTMFSANQALSILVRDLKQYENIMSGLLNTGLNRIDGVEFKTSKKEELQSEARKKAVLDAKMKAQEYAEALGQKIGNAVNISEGSSNHFQPVYRMAAMEDSSAKETIAPGEMEVTVKVNVSFLLL